MFAITVTAQIQLSLVCTVIIQVEEYFYYFLIKNIPLYLYINITVKKIEKLLFSHKILFIDITVVL